MLHLIHSKTAHDLASLVSLLDAESVLLLMGDACYTIQTQQAVVSDILASGAKLAVLDADVVARGMADMIADEIMTLAYSDFVELTTIHPQIQSWP